LKLGPILAQFLYQYKRLDLPGVGSFIIDAPEITESGKTIIPGISFESKPAVKEDPVLINYISEQSGKMKALASADFNSYLQLALQFLNIGKPFLFEGIGSLVRKSSGSFAFAPGETMQEAMKEYSAREITATTFAEESFNKYDEEKKKINWQKPVAILLILVSVVIVVWGGYTVYKKTKNRKNQTAEELPIIQVDTVSKKTDSLSNLPAAPQHYKYVLEIANKKRAIERFNMLKSYQWDVSMETKDSVSYTLYMPLPINSGDTSRIKDSLTALNGRRVFIEH
jgi:hypothetical protein